MIVETLESFAVGNLTKGDVSIATEDGGADVYGLGSSDGIMVNHASGDQIWEAMVRIADKACLAILPAGCPACVTRSGLLDDLPSEPRSDARVVTSGEQLVAVISE